MKKCFPSRILWNLGQFETVNVNTEMGGTLLAPNAEVTIGANVNGAVFAKEFYQMSAGTEIHWVSFDGELEFGDDTDDGDDTGDGDETGDGDDVVTPVTPVTPEVVSIDDEDVPLAGALGSRRGPALDEDDEGVLGDRRAPQTGVAVPVIYAAVLIMSILGMGITLNKLTKDKKNGKNEK